MYFSRFLLCALAVSCLWAQAPAPKPPAAAPAPKVQLSVEPLTAPPPPAVPPDTVVITIGEEKITAGQMEQIISALPAQFQTSARSQRKQFGENFVRMKLMAAEARRRKLDQSPAYQAQLAFQADNMLAGLLFQNLAANVAIPEAESRKYFEAHKAEYESVKARHILVRMKGSPVALRPDQKDLTEEEALARAQELRKRLAAGEDFAKLAQAESDDVGSRTGGGDLGPFRRGQMVGPFEEAAFTLAPGQLSEPVKSPFGYHIIKVEKREARSYEEVKPELEKRMRPEAAQKTMEDLRKQANVTLEPSYFGQ